MSNIGGSVAAGWEPVREAFEHNLSTPDEVGATVSVYHRGAKVVDLWGGSFDEAGSAPYADDTLQVIFSTTKGIAAIAVAMCVERGLLAYSDRVADHWPEFAAHGKGDATVAQLLSHQCGLYTVDGPITLGEALDWDTVTARVADTAPRWPIGSAHGYHALTYGWLAGELVRRVDPTHRGLGTFVQEEISGPLGVDLFIGLPAALEPRVSPMIPSPMPDDPSIKAIIETFIGPGTALGDALTLNQAFGSIGSIEAGAAYAWNSPEVHAAEVPGAGGVSNARALARVYAATLGAVDGVQLFGDETRTAATTRVTPAGEIDSCITGADTTFGMGFMLHSQFSSFAGPGCYGHPGAGGSVAFADPGRDLAFGYVMNKMTGNLAGDPRPQALIAAAVASAAAV